jgi:hypothetical protein
VVTIPDYQTVMLPLLNLASGTAPTFTQTFRSTLTTLTS